MSKTLYQKKSCITVRLNAVAVNFLVVQRTKKNPTRGFLCVLILNIMTWMISQLKIINILHITMWLDATYVSNNHHNRLLTQAQCPKTNYAMCIMWKILSLIHAYRSTTFREPMICTVMQQQHDVICKERNYIFYCQMCCW